MGHGASKDEKLDGTAVTGKWCKRIEMPPGVIGEQMAGGPYPGKKMLSFTPLRLQELNAAKSTTSLYLEFQKAVCDECGGNRLAGWDSKKIYEVVSRFKPRFQEKGVNVEYSMVKWYVHHGQSGHMEYRYWLSFIDLQMSAAAVPVAEAFDPEKDYSKMDADEAKLFNETDQPFVVVGTLVDEGKFAALDPCGTWVADMATATGSLQKWVTSMECTTTRQGSVYETAGTYKLSMWCFSRTGRFTATMQPVPGKTDEFLVISSDGVYSKAVVNTLDSFTITESTGGGSVVWNRRKGAVKMP